MEEFAVQFSIGDALQILDDSPLQPDAPAQTTLIQITNRIPTAHLAIERGLKFLIEKHCGKYEKRHDLHKHLRKLRELDPSAIAFLEKAFDDATAFYGLNHNRPNLSHIRSLDAYLATVGTTDAFNRMRYWELNPEREESLFRKVWPTIHREVLLGVSKLCASNPSESETIAGRVEQTVHDALFPTEQLVYSPRSGHEATVKCYIDWVLNHPSRQVALTQAFRQDFAIGDEFMNRIVSQAYQSLDPITRSCHQIPCIQNRCVAHTTQRRDSTHRMERPTAGNNPERYSHREEPSWDTYNEPRTAFGTPSHYEWER